MHTMHNNFHVFFFLVFFITTTPFVCAQSCCLGPVADNLDAMYSACLSNIVCAELYDQEPAPNRVVFDYILGHSTSDSTVSEFIDALTCNLTAENAAVALAPLVLVYWTALRPACPANMVFSLNGPTGECICIPGRDCGEHRWWNSWLAVLLISQTLIIMIGTFVVLSGSWKIKTDHRS